MSWVLINSLRVTARGVEHDFCCVLNLCILEKSVLVSCTFVCQHINKYQNWSKFSGGTLLPAKTLLYTRAALA